MLVLYLDDLLEEYPQSDLDLLGRRNLIVINESDKDLLSQELLTWFKNKIEKHTHPYGENNR